MAKIYALGAKKEEDWNVNCDLLAVRVREGAPLRTHVCLILDTYVCGSLYGLHVSVHRSGGV